MAYSELVKNFERVRDYMREFYVYGFKSRTEYDKKSSRSYDNERRRIESWLGDYMSFRQDGFGKNVFLSVDSRSISSNPLYEAFKAKSFTKDDKFRLISFSPRNPLTINLARVRTCQLLDPYTEGEYRPKPMRRKRLVLEVTDERNALERVMLHFSHFEKATEKIDDLHYRMTMKYEQEDETEILIRVLSFGPVLRVAAPESFVKLVRQRLVAQEKLRTQK